MSERGSEIVFRAENIPVRFFKACRWCRRQKMRCDARNQVPAFAAAQQAETVFLTPLKIQEDATTVDENHPLRRGKFLSVSFFLDNLVRR